MLQRLLLVLSAILAIAPLSAFGASSDPYDLEIDSESAVRVVIVGATLGEDWGGFPDKLAMDYTATGSSDRLNHTLPLYVTWILDSNVGTTPQIVDPPQLITDFDWFDGYHDEFEMVDTGEPNYVTDGRYTACADNEFLEAPTFTSFPLTSDGEITLQDVHGGNAVRSLLRFQRCVFSEGLNCGDNFNILVGWTNPGTWFDDYEQESVNLAPGDVYLRRISGPISMYGYVPIRAVEWISSDIGFASPRIVDSADISSFFSYYGSGGVSVRWGWETGESPATSPNFFANIAPFSGSANYLDAADLSAFVSDISKSCGLSKADDENPAAIMAWFGCAPTGGPIAVGPNGETVPEYAIVNSEQLARGLANPEGYRTQNAASASRVPWARLKGLYR